MTSPKRIIKVFFKDDMAVTLDDIFCAIDASVPTV